MKSVRTLPKPKPTSSFMNDLPLKQEVPKVSLPTHDTDKFWLSVDPYCCDVSKDDVNVSITINFLHLINYFYIVLR